MNYEVMWNYLKLFIQNQQELDECSRVVRSAETTQEMILELMEKMEKVEERLNGLKFKEDY